MSKSSSPVPWSPFTLSKKINDWWITHCDAYLRDLPLFESPLSFISLLLTISAVILISEQYIKRRKRIIASLSKSASKSISPCLITDHRPITLIHNGFCFGVYGVALLLLITVTYYGKLLFSCDPVVKFTEFHQNSLKHTLYTYLIMTFAVFVDPLARVLAGAKIDHTIDILHQVIWSIILTGYTAVNPIGITMALVVIDAVHNVIKYGSAVLSINVPEDKKGNYYKAAEVIRIVFYCIISTHVYQVTSLIKGNKCRPPIAGKGHVYDPVFLFPVTVYAAIVIAVSVIRLAALFLTPDVIGKQQAVAAGASGIAAKAGGAGEAAAAAATSVNGKNLRKSIRLSKTSTSTSSL
jgi:hypothetical protein